MDTNVTDLYYANTNVTIQKISRNNAVIGYKVTNVATGDFADCLTFGEAILRRREMLNRDT